MTATHGETRRGFFGVFLFAAGGTAAVALTACTTAVGGGGAGSEPYQVGVVEPAEVVALRPGVTYQNVAPKSVPAVRRALR